jgi:hypothetical protein
MDKQPLTASLEISPMVNEELAYLTIANIENNDWADEAVRIL